jgi:ATP-dependent Lon protease
LDAGCKTLLIPKENLVGPEGMERLPQTLKRELQILTYEEWEEDHPPFDYDRHILQVVAVDHIVQAAHVAFIYAADIQAMEDLFVSHGRQVSQAMEKAPRVGEACLYMVYIKDPKEVDPERMESLSCKGCRTVLLQPPEYKEEPEKKLPALPPMSEIKAFDAKERSLTALVRELHESDGKPSTPFPVTVVAPFFFLKRDGIRLEDLPLPEKSRLFANNFTVQGVKIKTCKNTLNRVYCFLAGLEREILESCPFLRKVESVYCADLSFIPEKYRLDVKHAEEILLRCLNRWLRVVEEAE